MLYIHERTPCMQLVFLKKAVNTELVDSRKKKKCKSVYLEASICV